MSHSESIALNEFKAGLALLRDNYPGNALLHLHHAVELDNNNPYYLSFCGLAVALAQNKWAEAEILCESALRLKRGEPRFYLNLAEVYVKAGRRADAAEILRMGLHFAGRSAQLAVALGRLGDRRPPVFSFLDRSSVMNRGAGKLRHLLLRLMQHD